MRALEPIRRCDIAATQKIITKYCGQISKNWHRLMALYYLCQQNPLLALTETKKHTIAEISVDSYVLLS